MNDSSWRSLSAILGMACVALIIVAGMLLMTSPGGATTPSGDASGSLPPIASGSNGSGSQSPTVSKTPAPKTPSVLPTPVAKAPIAQVTFNNLALDATSDLKATPRTFTFVTDGVGPVGIAILKYSTANIRVCARVDDSAWSCIKGGKVSFKGAYTDTAHSVWSVTLLGVASYTPTVDLSLSWPTNNPSVTLTHGRFQGSSTPGISEALNGVTATFKARASGNVGLSASWTLIKPNVAVTLADVTSQPAVNANEKQYTGVSDLGAPGFSYQVTGARFSKVSLRNLSADSQRPDLRAVITFP